MAAVTPIRFMVTEGVRTAERQRELYAHKKTKTLKSLHLVGRAVDIVPLVNGKPSWQWKHYTPLIKTAKQVGAQLGLRLEFGYDWGWDAPHIGVHDYD